jgi:hypothetical protein
MHACTRANGLLWGLHGAYRRVFFGWGGQTLIGLHCLSYGHGHRVTAQRARYSKPTVERQFVRFSGKIRSAEDCKDLSSVYFGEARVCSCSFCEFTNRREAVLMRQSPRLPLCLTRASGDDQCLACCCSSCFF